MNDLLAVKSPEAAKYEFVPRVCARYYNPHFAEQVLLVNCMHVNLEKLRCAVCIAEDLQIF